ncbi:hypothetical protein NF27_IE00150 [Candidatus Jidaibacter acanthamoeba]|uniref:F-box domain-containing protein n=1 Tax=Candidatus Jidaibacter acanthamoebae TaxID=86105 RepID=A0A0C1QFM8_9RICK|nr:ankyrin repeat domain-containing protein [Candidatus Jidaibacter acanthamoeba]KIE04379.1 hypothetical protein NF27_IE00150 [Candidatus Jidaibacter acanthamoeba]
MKNRDYYTNILENKKEDMLNIFWSILNSDEYHDFNWDLADLITFSLDSQDRKEILERSNDIKIKLSEAIEENKALKSEQVKGLKETLKSFVKDACSIALDYARSTSPNKEKNVSSDKTHAEAAKKYIITTNEKGNEIVAHEPVKLSNSAKELHRVAANDDIKTLKFLLEKNIDPSIKEGKFHSTALNAAVFNRHLEAVQLLTQYNANISLADIYGKTPIDNSREDVTHNPASEKALDIKETLYLSLAQQNQEAIFKAIYNGNIELAKKLINKNPDSAFCYNKQGYNAFLWAALYNKVDLLVYLVLKYEEKIIETKDKYNWNTSNIAAYSPSLSSFTFLLNVYGWSKEEVENAYNTAINYKNNYWKNDKKDFFIDQKDIYKEIEKIVKHQLDLYIPKISILSIFNYALPLSQALRNAQFFDLPEEIVTKILTFLPGAEVLHSNTIGNLLNKLVSDKIVSIENLNEILNTPVQTKFTEQLIRERKNLQKEDVISNYI